MDKMTTEKLELERYKTIVNHFENNRDRLGLKENQIYLTRLYATLIHKRKENFKELANRIHTLVKGPNYLLGHWEELNRLNKLEKIA